MCDMIPNAEHWRVPVWYAQQLQHDMMGYLPGYATPRIVCDVPFVGKRWVHMLTEYDREHGISYWTKNYRTSIEADDDEALTKLYAYYDPIDTLPESGQDWWRKQADADRRLSTHTGTAPGAFRGAVRVSWLSCAQLNASLTSLPASLTCSPACLACAAVSCACALGDQALVVGGVADALLRLAGQLFGLVLDLVSEAHRQPLQ